MLVQGYIWYIFLLVLPVAAIDWPWEDNSSSASGSATATETDSDRNQYAPYETDCPSGSLTRQSVNISDGEKEYITHRWEKTNTKLIEFLSERANLSDFDAESYINDYSDEHNITIGVAFSGGGYRAMLCGAGELLGLDDRYDGEDSEKGLGGLLQSATYIAGLSGGNWLVGLMVLNDWISVADIYSGEKKIWDLEDSIFNPNGINVIKTVEYYKHIYDAINAKKDAGFDTSITDIWGRALSNQFFEGDQGGENITWSSIQDLSSFKDHEMPFPVVVADGRTPGTYIINSNSTVFEFNPFEMGSWDPSVHTFFDVKYLGSGVLGGDPKDDKCTVNFDNAGFVLGTSSSLFNQVILRLPGTDLPSVLKTLVNKVLKLVSNDEDDIAVYEPNPFYDSEYGGLRSVLKNETLYLCDGGEDNQNVPLYPLIQTLRKLDIILAYDNSADTDQNWPNGSSLVETYQRQYSVQGRGTPFPYVPSVDEFVDKELNQRPVFFGCDASNLTDLVKQLKNTNINETDVPLVVYMPNHRHSYNSNTSTYKMSYDNDEKWGVIRNGFEVTTQNNGTTDDGWATCMGCAIIRRSQERRGIQQSSECEKCFQKYCWNGGSKDAAASTQAASPATSSSSSSSSSKSSSESTSTGKKKGAASSVSAPWQAVVYVFLLIGGAFVI